MRIMGVLENHYRDLCDIEFTVERGRLWMLQTRVGKRTAAAAFRIAVQLVDEGVIDLDTALTRVTGHQLALLMFPQFDPQAERSLLARGMAASPGAAVGRAAFDSATAIAWAGRGENVVLVRRETNPDDLGGMVAAVGVLTSRGGKTSHAAVVARGMGRTASSASRRCASTRPARCHHAGRPGVRRGRRHLDRRLDRRGLPRRGAGRRQRGGAGPAGRAGRRRRRRRRRGAELLEAVSRLMNHADRRRRLGVRANADTPEDAARARGFGAEGIGLCRTEHMFLGPRRTWSSG